MTKKPLDLYQEYFIDHDFERLDLFHQLAEKYPVQRVLYPGSFVHITPSFVFPFTTYVDSDKRAHKFFQSPGLGDFIEARKIYPQKAVFNFHAADYREPFCEADKSFDILISQYAGFVSQHCKSYLKIGGILLVNNSHGDAGMASIDRDYALIGVIIRRSGNHRISEKNLDTYFIPKMPINNIREVLEKTQKGIGYTRTASSYLFRRI
jgi:hypothetical protein